MQISTPSNQTKRVLTFPVGKPQCCSRYRTGTDTEPSIGNIIVKIIGIKEWWFPASLPKDANCVGYAVCDTTTAVSIPHC